MPDSVRNYIIVFVVAFLALGFFIVFLAALYTKRQIKNKNEVLKMQAAFAEMLLRSQLEIKEQTLQQISRELHDNLSQVASLIKINLNTLQFADIERATQKVEDTKTLTRRLITDLKALSVSLSNEGIVRNGLANALQSEIEMLNRAGQFNISFQQHGTTLSLNAEKAVILYRMVQELLNNVIKHSGAKQVRVQLNSEEKLITLAVQDDGDGFDVEDKLQHGGAGLHNLQHRARLMNAQLSLRSTPGQGTTATIQLPL